MRLLSAAIIILTVEASCTADDWPTWQHDSRRSGFSREQIDAENLKLNWVWQSSFPPQPAWHGPAKWDAYARIRDLPAMRSYDQVFHVVVADDNAFFGSSADDSVRCLDLATGDERWKYVTDGPVRVAPVISDGNVYFGSDDGFVYCLEATTGKQLWKFRPVEPEDELKILNNGRFIPLNPCRTGVVINGDNAWFACGMLPWHPSWLCSVNAQTGRAEGDGTFVRKLDGQTIEGAPALSSDLVLFPQGRVAPQIFSRADGSSLGTLKKSGGGSIVVVSLDSSIFHGPATDSRRGGIGRSDPKTREMVAGYGRGSALIVSDRMSYMLADDELIASDLATREVLFQVPCDQRLSLAGAGNVVFAGGEDSVAAFNSRTGQRIWQHAVDGKTYGLAIANGRLIASTDTGAICSFRADGRTATGSDSITSQLPPEKVERTGSIPSADRVDDDHLLGHWVFRRANIRGKAVQNLAGGRPGRTVTGPLVQTRGKIESLELDGSGQSVLISNNHRDAKLPRRTISAEAWVRVDEPTEWGGIVGAIQDNGDFERGWLLGYRKSQFCFAVSGVEGNGRLTYLTAETDFTHRHWHHVAATYDGSQMLLYVNGKLASSSKQQAGDIQYPLQAFYEIGAYHDKDEYHRLNGSIHEVRIYDDVLTAEEISTNHAAKAEHFPKPVETIALETGPWLEFTGPDSAVIRWQTADLSETSLELAAKSGSETAAVPYGDESLKREHEVCLRSLKRNRMYSYVIHSKRDGKRGQTREFECDTFFNYTLPSVANQPQESDVATSVHRAADIILERSKVKRGLAIVVGLEDGQLLRSLCRNPRLRVVAVDDDPVRVARVRDSLENLYGVRVTVHLVDNLEAVPFVGHVANLVTTERRLDNGFPTTFEEVVRLLRPDGGVAVFGQSEHPSRETLARKFRESAATRRRHVESKVTDDREGVWVVLKSRPWKDTGAWTHLYGRTDNSAFGGESLSGVKSREDLKVQWVGRPGPRYQADRSGRKPSPLAVGGRLFLQGLERIIALDSYNGSVLWSLEIPGFTRFNVPRDAGNWCTDRDNVFAVVRDRVWQIDAATGQVVQFHNVAPIERDDWQTQWGFVARSGGQLIGSSVKAGSSWAEYWGKEGWHDARSGPSTFQVVSDRLFAKNVEDGSDAWNWSNGVILNPSITIADGRVYFVECRHPDIVKSKDRRLGSPELWQQQYLVALDASTGSKLWEKPIDTVDGSVAFYMAHAQQRLVIVSSAGNEFHISAYSDDGGESLWEQKVGWIEGKGDHGKAMSRPAIVGERLFVRPQVLSLTDGKVLPITMPGGGCGTYACTTDALFFRAGNVTVWDSESGKATAWPRLRPDCWLSTIPADGMLLAPEGGGGCSCGSWMETSIGFMPAARRSLKVAR